MLRVGKVIQMMMMMKMVLMNLPTTPREQIEDPGLE